MENYLVVNFVCFCSNCFSQTAILKQPKVIEQCQTKIELAAENIEIKRLKEQYYRTHKSALYQAGNYVELKTGFEANAGIHFKARIKGCDYSE